MLVYVNFLKKLPQPILQHPPGPNQHSDLDEELEEGYKYLEERHQELVAAFESLRQQF